MIINRVSLQNFRCFSKQSFSFDKKMVLIEGGNGSGKTTLLEALHYACYFKSFRTSSTKDLVTLDKNHFFFSVGFLDTGDVPHDIQVGLSYETSPMKRVVKLNGKKIRSYKELISHYRVITLAEDDLQIVQGGPEHRRTFLDQLVLLFNPEFHRQLKQYEQIKEQRNSMLKRGQQAADIKQLHVELELWSKQLWHASRMIQQERIARLELLEREVNRLLEQYFSQENLSVRFSYQVKKHMDTETFEGFWKSYAEKQLALEWRLGRSLFGAHLDDILLLFQSKGVRAFASRGQQKLIVFLLKIAELQLLEQQGIKTVLLLDDFLTDFDESRSARCFDILTQLPSQTIITCPISSFFSKRFSEKQLDVQVIAL